MFIKLNSIKLIIIPINYFKLFSTSNKNKGIKPNKNTDILEMQNNKLETLLAVQMQMIVRHLQNINKEHVIDLSMKIFPQMQSTDPYMCLYANLKKLFVISCSKYLPIDVIVDQVITKAFAIDGQLGGRMTNLLKGQTQFLRRFQSNTHNNAFKNDNSQEGKIIINPVSIQIRSANEEAKQIKLPLKQTKQMQKQVLYLQDDSSVYKIGLKQHKQGNKQADGNINGYNKTLVNSVPKNIMNTYVKNVLNSQIIIDLPAMNRKNDNQRINLMRNPLSSGRSVVNPPLKNDTHFGSHGKKISFLPLLSSLPRTTFFPPPSQPKQTKQIVDRYFQDSLSTRNLSQKSLCLCEASCQNIVLSQDSFLCIHCKNIYHTRCMKKTKDSQNCVICHLKYMIPNKLTHQQLFVGVLRKTNKKHQVHFSIGQQIMNMVNSKKDFSLRLQVRCFRLKPQTLKINLFPDSCAISFNGKQLKELKPLHKQSSLKYRKDEPISIFKNYQLGDNRLTITEFHGPSYGSIDRIQPEDHLIGLYLIQEETLNSTVQRVIRDYVTTLQQSKDLLEASFHLNYSKPQNSAQELITCEVIKIPLTCALTTDKLKYPARGIFCKHFQCFDLRNFIMMTSSSLNPRWVCPICKASCYEYRIDCILTQILNRYTGCDKVQLLMLYKDGAYDVLSKEQDPIDQKGNKQRNPRPKNINELNIQDRFKRQRQKEKEKQLLRLQLAEQKKRIKTLYLPPQDQIVDLLSDSD